MIGARFVPDPSDLKSIRDDPEMAATTSFALTRKSKAAMADERLRSTESRRATAPYKASLELLLQTDELVPDFKEPAGSIVLTSIPRSDTLRDGISIGKAWQRRKSQVEAERSAQLPIEARALLEPPALRKGGSVARLAVMRKEQELLQDALLGDLAERRRNWKRRFEFIGDFWMRKLRHCGWRQSLRMAFEVPALHSAKYAEMGHHIPKAQFVAACNYAIQRNEKVVGTSEFDDFCSKCFDMFDIEGVGKVDYREFLCALLFFRIEPTVDAGLLVNMWYRYYDGDVNEGLSYPDFLQMMVTLCVNQDETNRLLRLMDVQSLERAPGARSQLGHAEPPSHATIRGGQIVAAADGSLVMSNVQSAHRDSLVRGNGVSSKLMDAEAAHARFLDSALVATRHDMTDREKALLDIQSSATHSDARRMGDYDGVPLTTNDILTQAHVDLLQIDSRNNSRSGSRRGKTRHDRRDLYLVPRTPDWARQTPDQSVTDVLDRAAADDGTGGAGTAAVADIRHSAFARSNARRSSIHRIEKLQKAAAAHGFSIRGVQPSSSEVAAGNPIRAVKQQQQNHKPRPGSRGAPLPPLGSDAAGQQDSSNSSLNVAGGGVVVGRSPDDASGHAVSDDHPNNNGAASDDHRARDGDDDVADDGSEFVDDRSEGEKERDLGMERRAEQARQNTAIQSQAATASWETMIGKGKRLLNMKKALDAVRIDDADPEAPWNRGVGTLTEVRVRRTTSMGANGDGGSASGSNNWDRSGVHRRRRGNDEDDYNEVDPASAAYLRNPYAAVPTSVDLGVDDGDGDDALAVVPSDTVMVLPQASQIAQQSRRSGYGSKEADDGPTFKGNPYLVKPISKAVVTIDSIPGYQTYRWPTRVRTADDGDGDVLQKALVNDPVRAAQAKQRQKEGLRAGALVEPVSIKRITLPMIRYMINLSPGLLDELHRLRLLRLPASVRSEFLSEQMQKQISHAKSKYEQLREHVQAKRAVALFRARQTMKCFQLWKGFARFGIWQRVKTNSLRARRAVRKWFMRAKESKVWKVKVQLADSHAFMSILRSTFKQWKLFKRIEVRETETRELQATRFQQHTLKEKYFKRLQARAKLMRARKHYAASIAHKLLRAWVSAVNLWKRDRATTDLAARVADERLQKTREEIIRQDDEAAAEEAYNAEVEAFEQFQREAERVQEEQRMQKLREDAERKLRDNRIMKMQLEAREVNYRRRMEVFKQRFEHEWAAKIKAAVMGARAEAQAYCESKDGKLAMKEDAKILLMGDTVEAVSQEESDFSAHFDMSDGCIHLIREADLTTDPPRERVDLNMDSMRLKDAVNVAAAHYVAKRGCRMRAELLIDKAKAWKTALENRSAMVFQHRWHCKQDRADFLDSLRRVIEQLVDPHTGALYYYNRETKKVFDTKPVLFRQQDVHPPPDFFLKWDPTLTTVIPAAPVDPATGAAVDVDGSDPLATAGQVQQGGWIYAHRRVPWKMLNTPPENYRICQVCNMEFATRRCHGLGCYGLLYCWNCFNSYHPESEVQWEDHWDNAERITVRQLNRAEMEEERNREAARLEMVADAAEAAARPSRAGGKASKNLEIAVPGNRSSRSRHTASLEHDGSATSRSGRSGRSTPGRNNAERPVSRGSDKTGGSTSRSRSRGKSSKRDSGGATSRKPSSKGGSRASSRSRDGGSVSGSETGRSAAGSAAAGSATGSGSLSERYKSRWAGGSTGASLTPKMAK